MSSMSSLLFISRKPTRGVNLNQRTYLKHSWGAYTTNAKKMGGSMKSETGSSHIPTPNQSIPEGYVQPAQTVQGIPEATETTPRAPKEDPLKDTQTQAPPANQPNKQ
eukprot:TRINITY_DN27329_c0_g1_i1.p1 TRINITY_DN27329_c0_g1~~TRINITY_DN27329_c0_g1_i1.p1  ORF type:complete len:107 (+),score=27.57 TRINITY_DN27329_c0_g1_i1:42-362(+)